MHCPSQGEALTSFSCLDKDTYLVLCPIGCAQPHKGRWPDPSSPPAGLLGDSPFDAPVQRQPDQGHHPVEAETDPAVCEGEEDGGGSAGQGFRCLSASRPMSPPPWLLARLLAMATSRASWAMGGRCSIRSAAAGMARTW